MTRRHSPRTATGGGTAHHTAPVTGSAPWVFPFDRSRHEIARLRLGPDRAADYRRPTTTADVIELHGQELDELCLRSGWDQWSKASAPATVHDALARQADVEERHLVLIGDEPGHDALALAELAVAHRRQLSRHAAAHRPLLGLALVLLTHQLHAAGRFADAIATGCEAIAILDDPHADIDTRPALVLALDAALMTCLVNGRHDEALADLVRATQILGDLARDGASFERDLANHLTALGVIGEGAAGVLDDASSSDRPTREPDVGGALTKRTHADELYDEGVRLATSDGDGPAAAAAVGGAVALYRRLLAVQTAELWYPTLRRLARALWRHAVVLNELLDRPRDAMGAGREALALTRRALHVVECADELDQLVAELGVRLHDLSHIALRAGRIAEHDQLAEEARRIDTASVGEAGIRALGAALHDRAAEACETTVALAARDRDLHATVQAGLHTSAAAVRTRRAVVDQDPMSRWELANSQLAHGHLRCLNGEGQAGAQAIADAYETVRVLPGPAGLTMREAAEAALLAACTAYPDITPQPEWLI